MSDPKYMAVRFHGETMVGKVLAAVYGKDDPRLLVVILTEAIRILEVTLPERGPLGQITTSTKPSILPVIPTETISLPNEVTVHGSQLQWSTPLTEEQFTTLVKSIGPAEKKSDLSPGDLAGLGSRRSRS